MINKIFGLFLLLALVSCEETKPESENGQDIEKLEDNFTIAGNINGGGNLTFHLEALTEQGPAKVAEMKADGNGKFKMTGNLPGMGLYQLRMGESNEKIIPLTVVPNDNLNINATVDNFIVSPELSGTDWASTMSKYMKIYSDFHFAQVSLMEQKDEISNLELTKRFKALKVPVDSFAIAEMRANPGNAFNIVLSDAATPNMGFIDWDPENIDVLNRVCDAFNKKYPETVAALSLSNKTYKIEMNYRQHVKNTSGTLPAPEIALNNPDGVELKLSSLKGKYVLIDFWASWCGPCRRESPNVVRLYNKYKDRGFTIYSVSLDDNMEAWKAAIKSDGLAWPNHVSDLLKWNSPLPQLYGFTGIPHTVLINKEGNVIGVGLRGESLEQKLNEVFSK
ncbi:thioredoxin-like domain-containing protein [Crocinitomicaceae bacterium]|nr:thioredoxin-like domain-containing protein [Crocinitomicaceae bacterium]MDC0098996.1 thioredoxin-like domain-containing protein [Crocinitomicaceae bacterium]